MASKRFPISLRELEVLAVRDLSPRLRRITFGGPQMGAFVSADGFAIPPFASEGPDDHVKMFFPDPATGVLSLPVQDDGHLNWPSDPPATTREYTPRGFDPAAGTCDFDFVLHEHGIATTWARQARPGDRLFFAGPKASMILPEADWYLLIGDETALPAIANWLEMLAPEASVHALVMIGDPSAQIALSAPAKARIEWLLHDPANPEHLRDAAAGVDLPPGKGFVWAAGEREAIRRLRAHLLEERGLEKRQLDLAAYWHLGVDEAMEQAAYDRLEALTDLGAPFAIRAAASFGLAAHVDAGAADVAALAAASGCPADLIALLVPILVDCAVFTRTEGKLGLDTLGRILVEDDHEREHLDWTAAAGRRGLAWAGLLPALAGQDAYAAVHGRSYAQEARDPALAGRFADEHGHLLEDLAEDAARHIALPDGALAVDVDGGIGTFLLEVLERLPGIGGMLVESEAVRAAAAEHVGQSAHAGRVALRGAEDVPQGAAAYLLGGRLGRLDAAAARERLESIAGLMGPQSKLFVLEPGATAYPRWEMELRLAQGPGRSFEAIVALAQAAGLAETRRVALPEGVLLEFART